MNLMEDIRVNSGIVELNEALFIGRKIFFKNSRRLVKFSVVLGKKIEKESKKIEQGKESTVDIDILKFFKEQCTEASKLFFDLETKYELSNGKDREVFKILYEKSASQYKKLLSILQKDETQKALFWIGMQTLSIVLTLTIASFFSIGFNSIIAGKAIATGAQVLNKTQEILPSEIKHPDGYLKSVAKKKQEMEVLKTLDVVEKEEKKVDVNFISNFFSKLEKTEETAKAEKVAVSIAKTI